MINNRLTYKELEKILLPILRLEEIEEIKGSIYKVLHFTRALPSEKAQYRICSDTTGINSTYKKFELEVRRLNDSKNAYIGVIIQFRKKKSFIDSFVNPIHQIVNDLKRICEKEISDSNFKEFDPGGRVNNESIEKFLIQSGTLYDNWKEENKLSPLTIFTQENSNIFLVEFSFEPLCYVRNSSKTTLRNDWQVIFNLNIPPWQY